MPQSDPDPLCGFKASSPLYTTDSPWISTKDIKITPDLPIGKTASLVDFKRVRDLLHDIRDIVGGTEVSAQVTALADEILDLLRDA